MAFPFIKKRWQRILAVELIGFAVIIFIVGLFINIYWSPILSDRLKTIVSQSTDSLYKVDFSEARLNVLQGKITISNIRLKTDSATYQRLKDKNLAPNNIYNLQVKKLVIKNIHPFRLYFFHELEIGDIILSAPHLQVSYRLNHAKDTIVTNKRTLYQQISATLKKIHIAKIMLNDVVLAYADHRTDSVITTRLSDLNLNAQDLLIDSATQHDKGRFLYCREMNAELNNFSGQSANGLYKYFAKQITFSTRNSQLNAYKCSLVATRPLNEFFARTYRDRFVFNLDSLQLNRFDFQGYNKYHQLHASALQLHNGNLSIFGNPHFDPKIINANRINSFPNQAIFLLQNDLKLDTINVKNINLTYQEYGVKTQREGRIIFNHINGNFYNITNNAEAIKANPMAHIKLNSSFMNKALLSTEFTFNLADPLRSYSYKGNLGTIKLSAINPVSVPLAALSVNGGKCTNLSFDVSANSKHSQGKVTFLYDNLRVHLLKADTVKNKLHHLRLASIIANNIYLKRNNPDTIGVAPRSAIFNTTRPQNMPFFKTLFKTIINGIKPCVGFDEATQKEVKQRMVQHEIDKAIHKQKKLLKQQRKAEKKMLLEKQKAS